MKYKRFKEHTIKRTCRSKFDKYRKYAPYLEKDFQARCCYCNMDSALLTISYHVEHFIPVKVFSGKRDSLLTDYDNLMWACPKCNLSKGDKFKGNVETSDKIRNELFYNPVEVDYNNIFYRNEIGGIASEDPLGQEMIRVLKLYRPIHNLAWLIERLERMVPKLEQIAALETDPERRMILEEAAGRLARIHLREYKLFRAAYSGKQFVEVDYE